MSRVIGIDLGTTNSVAAFMDGDRPTIIPTKRGTRVTPSVVGFTETGEVLVGESAKNQAVVHADRTIVAAKRQMGATTQYRINSRILTPEEVSSLILKSLKEDAEDFLGGEVSEAVITVPAHFQDHQRSATVEAGRRAGLRVRRVLNEPTAAALAFAHSSGEAGTILVYDLGGGTFDVTCLSTDSRRFSVRSTVGDGRLGGVDFDNLLLNHVREVMARESPIDLQGDPFLEQQLRDLTERAKIELSSSRRALIALPFVAAAGRAVHLRCEVDRGVFEELIEPLVSRTIELTLRAIQEAGLSASDIDSLVLSGGSSRIPLVRLRLEQIIGERRVSQVNPDEIVALGAAIQAGMLEGSQSDVYLEDVTGYALSVEVDGGRCVRLVPRNAALPAKGSRTFTTVNDRQDAVEIHILQGDKQVAANNTSLGRFMLSGIRDAAAGVPRIHVEVGVDSNGIAHVRARDVDTGVSHRVELQPLQEHRDETEMDRIKRLRRTIGDLLGVPEVARAAGDLGKQLRVLLDAPLRTDNLNERIVALEAAWKELSDLQDEVLERERR